MSTACQLPARHRSTLLWSAALLSMALTRLSALPAFPGAEGFGYECSGGRGGTVYHVTNLNDSGTGSFRDAVSASGRTVVFDVGGIITLSSPVVVKGGITIAGQTAPGEGITLYGDRLSFSGASNLIMRYIRIREGINGDSGTDAAGAASGDGMIFDHVSVSWGRDENFSFSGTPSKITIQDCIIGQGLLIHSAGGLIQTSGGVSILRTLYIDNWMRNPKIKGVNDFQNNVVYNWGGGGGYIPAGDSAGLSYANMVGNYFIAGPSSPSSPFKTGNKNYNLYHAGNYKDMDLDGALTGVAVGDDDFPTLSLVPAAFDYPAPDTLLTAEQSLRHVMKNAGASLHRDLADNYMIDELSSLGTKGALITTESEIGGVGTLDGGLKVVDTDADGMPDWWETAAGTSPTTADNNVLNPDGYTNLEHYLNAIAPAGVRSVSITGVDGDTGSSATDGITSTNKLFFRGTTTVPGGTVSLFRADAGLIGTALADASGNWSFDYTGTPLADRYYAFNATVLLPSGKTSTPSNLMVVNVDTVPAATPVITSVKLLPSLVITGTSEPGSVVNVLLGGTVVATTTTDRYGNWSASYTGEALAPGSYDFKAQATDVAGNTGAECTAYNVNTGIAAPVFTEISTDSGLSSSDQITNDTSLILKGTAPADSTITVTRVGTGVVGTTTADSTGAWSFDFTTTTLTTGQHSFTATASLSGSASPASAVFTVTVDSVKPTISSIKRLSPTTVATTPTPLVFRVTFAEPVSGVDQTDFSLTVSGAVGTITGFNAVSTTVYDLTVTEVSGDGTIRLDRKATGTGIVDVAGNAAATTAYTSGQSYTIRLKGSGVWISDEDGATWSTPGNWEGGVIPNESGVTADFNMRDLTTNLGISLDVPVDAGRLIFGDADTTTPGTWTLSNNGIAANTLTLAGAAPSIVVNAATTSTGDTADVPNANATPTVLDAVLAGTSGFTKLGVGTLKITQPASISGALTITKGIVEVGTGGKLTTSGVSIATSQRLYVSGGEFSTTGNVTMTSGTGTGVWVTGGKASFRKIVPTNFRNVWVRVSGGVMTADDVSFLRCGDSESQAISNGLLIDGGNATITDVGLGTGDSWGAMTISGGVANITGTLHAGYQKTSARGGVITMKGGVLNVTNSSAGLIMNRNPGGSSANTNNVSKLLITDGVANIARIQMGYDNTSSAGTAILTLGDLVNTKGTPELNIGSGNLTRNTASGMTTPITLNKGILGAMASWTSSLPMTLAGTTEGFAIRAASSSGVAGDISLSGVLSGTGGFRKTGAGTLTLSGNNTFTGAVILDEGRLLVNGKIVAGDLLPAAPGTLLGGDGSIARQVSLASGATLAAGNNGVGALTLGGLVWNGGARLAVDLTSTGNDVIHVGGALTKGDGAVFEIAVNPLSLPASGTYVTIADFSATSFTAADFTITGMPADVKTTALISEGKLMLKVGKTPATVSLQNLSATYDGFAHPVTAITTPAGLTVDIGYGGSPTAPIAAGSYEVTGTINDPDYQGSSTGALIISKAPQTLAFSVPAALTYGVAPLTLSAEVNTGLPVTLSVVSGPATLGAGNVLTITGAGNVVLKALQAGDGNHLSVSQESTIVVAKAAASLAFKGLRQAYDGTSKPVTVSATPSDLVVDISYDGLPSAPSKPGSYAVVATVADLDYQGTLTGTLEIVPAAQITHAPTIGGSVTGALQVLSAENISLAGASVVSGDLLVPGSPTVSVLDSATLGSTIDADGSATPDTTTVTLSANAKLTRVVRRMDAVALPSVTAPSAPAGTRDVVIYTVAQTPGDFSTLRSLKIYGNAGSRAVPAGSYQELNASGNLAFILGTAGATEPSVYQLQKLTLSGLAKLRIVGPVILRIAETSTINMMTPLPSASSVVIEVSNGGLTLNANGNLAATVKAPKGTVTINAKSVLRGNVAADQLVIQATGQLIQETP